MCSVTESKEDMKVVNAVCINALVCTTLCTLKSVHIISYVELFRVDSGRTKEKSAANLSGTNQHIMQLDSCCINTI